ncbi:MAG: ribonuclease HII [Castellaniella sp.]|uniref:ribonuclease HII n=1 Tax=Castellaniella sp. TaxID=1955812 RepID=UPI002A36730A|nr:ribonuclease HII [Castellaniella sp.]MDY0308202.1 ribonuclease HII [Castellaniella sp.]
MGMRDLFGTAESSALIAGVDEAGRGPLAGPVYAAAVILDPDHPIEGLNDSKKLSPARRDRLAEQIRRQALAWAIASASVEEIERLNILQATMLAMLRACQGLFRAPTLVLVDGNRLPAGLSCPARAVVGGDALEPAISAASILAKTARDACCLELHARYPEYAFDRHKGYGTALHLARLVEFGPCPAHRRGFAPVRRALEGRCDSSNAPARREDAS